MAGREQRNYCSVLRIVNESTFVFLLLMLFPCIIGRRLICTLITMSLYSVDDQMRKGLKRKESEFKQVLIRKWGLSRDRNLTLRIQLEQGNEWNPFHPSKNGNEFAFFQNVGLSNILYSKRIEESGKFFFRREPTQRTHR